MESELSGIFRVKLVTKNIERGSLGTQFMHMRVNQLSLIKETLEKQLSPVFLQNSCSEQFRNFTENIGGGGLYVFRKGSKTSAIN